MNAPLISIIIPIYKVEQYLRRCLDSIINQTYTNLDIVLVDDGSPDKSPQICDDYAAKDNRITVIHKKNGGLSDARNAGLDICKGKFISFVDSDDWVDANYVKALFDLLTETNTDIAIGNFLKTDGSKKTPTGPIQHRTLNPTEAIICCTRGDTPAFAISCSKLYKKELFDKLRFPVGKYHEDEFTTYLLFYKSTSIAYTSQVLYYYYSREKSITSSQHPYDALEAFEQRYLFFKEKKELELLPHLLAPLCWLCLYCSFLDKENGDTQKREEHLQALRSYAKEPIFNKVSLFHRIFLKAFASFPYLYTFYRNYSPFLIRRRPKGPSQRIEKDCL